MVGCYSVTRADVTEPANSQYGKIYLLPDEDYYDLCVLPQMNQPIEDCADSNGGPSFNYIKWKGDLNGDSIEDVIIVNQSGNYNFETSRFSVLFGIKDGGYRLGGEVYTTTLVPTEKRLNGFLVLQSYAECSEEGIVKYKNEAEVIYNFKDRIYKSKNLVDESETICSLKK